MTLKQYEAVIQTLERLGGIATLGQLNQEVFKIANCNWNTKTPFASIRRIVQTRPKEIYKVRPGLYALVSHRGVIEGRGIFEQTKHNEEAKEVEHSTDIQNSLVKFNDLRDFHSRMVIVADLKRKKEYESKIRYSSFDELIREKRVSFLSYDELNKQYERLVEQQAFEFIL